MNGLLLHRPGDRLSLAELSAARLDGHVVELGEVYVAADLVETAALRAASLSSLLPRAEGAAFAGMSAAWIHGAGDAPPRTHELQTGSGRRLRLAPSSRLVVHDAALAQLDIRRLGGMSVASPERTLIDLLRWPSTIPERTTWARALADADPSLAGRALARTAGMTRGPGMDRVLTFLRARSTGAEAARAAQEEVTR